MGKVPGRKPSKRTRSKGTPFRPSQGRLPDPWNGLCPNGCGRPAGPLYVPGGVGFPGFYICVLLATKGA